MKSTLMFFTIIITVSLLSSCSKGIQYDCDFFEQEPAPEWVKRGGLSNIDEYEGVAMAHKSEKGFQDQVENAQSSAVNDLARSVQVNVETSISRSRIYRNKHLSKDEINKLSYHLTRVILKGVKREDEWIDQKSCTVWVYVTAKKTNIDLLLNKQIDEKAKLNKACQYSEKAQDSSAFFLKKMLNIQLAKKQLATVDFTLLSLSGLAEGPYSFYLSRYLKIQSNIIKKNDEKKELPVFFKAEKNAESAKNIFLNFYKRLEYIGKAIKMLNIINFDALSSSTLLRGGRSYYEEKYSSINQDILLSIKKVKEENSRLYDDATNRLDDANANLDDLARAKRDMDVADREIRKIEENILYFDKDLLIHLRGYFFDTHSSYRKKENFFRNLRIGMSVFEAERIFGKCDERRSESWGSSAGKKYGNYWLIFRNGILDCVVKESQFIPYGTKSLCNCREHRRKKATLFKD